MAPAPTTPTEPVLILGPHIAALGVLRVLARRGVPAFVVDDTTNVITRSRWYRSPGRTLAETPDPGALAEYLGALDLPDAALIACSDTWALAVAGLPTDLRTRFRASIAPRSAIERFVDKDRFRTLLDELDIPRPRTIPIREASDLALATDDDLVDGFLKPTESQAHNRHFKTKGFFVESREHARRIVDEGARAGVTFMLQEYIPGAPSSTVLVDGFVDRDGTIRGMVARRRLRMDPPRLANTCSDMTIPLAEVEACLPALRTLLSAVAYRGIFNAEFKFDERDGRFKIIELNPRPFWLIAHIARAGLDLPWLSYLDALDRPVPDPGPYEIGRYGLYEIPDATAIARALLSGRRPTGAVVRPWLRGDKALFWPTDPMPALFGLGQLAGRRFDRLRRQPRGHTAEADEPANHALSTG